MPICIGITSKGIQCAKNASIEDRCKTHYNSVNAYGPHDTARRELKYIHKKERDDALRVFQQAETTHPDATGDRRRVYIANAAVQKAQQNRMMVSLINQQQEQIRLTGVDPDHIARERNRERRQRLVNIQLERRALREAHAMAGLHLRRAALHAVLQEGNAQGRRVDEVRTLAAFVADPQNVHTSESVNQTKSIVEKIRLVPVPEGYRWHPINASKTPFEIGIECKLSQKAAWQMVSQYAQDTAIYDIEEGIYGKVLDCVWQYIKNSPDKNDLCVIVKNELEDNVGMCAQGNLSRICNILAGYMEGVGAQESLSEILGRLLPPLINIVDAYDRFRQACMILRDNKVPHSEWDAWTEAFIDDEDDKEIYELLKEALAV